MRVVATTMTSSSTEGTAASVTTSDASCPATTVSVVETSANPSLLTAIACSPGGSVNVARPVASDETVTVPDVTRAPSIGWSSARTSTWTAL